jgi:hypothetical protein
MKTHAKTQRRNDKQSKIQNPKSKISFLLSLCLCVSVVQKPAFAQGMFPFVIPWDDAAKTITDVSRLNPAPLDGTRRIVVKNGHFYDRTGRRVRFLGTNFTFNANFPNKADAAKVAARMHKYGFNCVRMHHMDMFKAPNGIFDPKFPDMQHLDPEQLDRMDWLIYQFKRYGIYIDLNLHVSRAFTAADGFPDTDKLPELGKVTAYFEPKMIELQKKYTHDLLTHVNPYTKTRNADEPTIALIELNNEDSLLGAAWYGQVENLPPYYKGELARQWNEFLAKKYRTMEDLKRAWGGGRPLGENLLKNGRFEDGPTAWTLEQQGGSRAKMQVEAETGPYAARVMRVKVEQLGQENWHVQFHQTGLDFREGESYTVQFSARADAPRSLPVYTGLDKDPWRHVGLDRSVQLTTEWKRYTIVFTASAPEKDHNRLSFVLGGMTGDVWLADLSLRPGIAPDIPPGQTLEARNIALPDSPSATPQGEDYTAFLMQTEDAYAQGMKRYIQDTLKAKALVTCSQASYGGLGGVWRESRMDWVDMHAYWQHPSFPRRPWDAKDWFIGNTAMVADPNGGTLPYLAMHRVEGKPFTVSEYNHPAPNQYRAEGLPMLAAYAAWQDWDGIFLFDYCGSRDEFHSDRIKGFFSVDTDPARMALMPAAAMLFLRGDFWMLDEPLKKATLVIPREQAVRLAARYGNNMAALWNAHGIADYSAMRFWMTVRLAPTGGRVLVGIPPGRENSPRRRTDPPSKAEFVAEGHHGCLAVGLIGGRTADFGGLRVTMKPTARNFAVFAITDMEGNHRGENMLLTAVGDVQNTGMGWNAAHTSVGDQWGTGPTKAEGISATVIASMEGFHSAKVYALGRTGKRVRVVPSRLTKTYLTFRIGPEYKTLWYEITAR